MSRLLAGVIVLCTLTVVAGGFHRAIALSLRIGAGGVDSATGVTVSEDGWVYVTGDSNNGMVAGQANHGGVDLFVARLHAAGARVWLRLVGGVEDDRGLAIDSPTKNAIYVAGSTRSDLDGTAQADDILLLRFDASGHPPLLRRLGGGGDDLAHSIAVTESAVLVAGSTTSTKLGGAPSLGLQDAFCARFK